VKLYDILKELMDSIPGDIAKPTPMKNVARNVIYRLRLFSPAFT